MLLIDHCNTFDGMSTKCKTSESWSVFWRSSRYGIYYGMKLVGFRKGLPLHLQAAANGNVSAKKLMTNTKPGKLYRKKYRIIITSPLKEGERAFPYQDPDQCKDQSLNALKVTHQNE